MPERAWPASRFGPRAARPPAPEPFAELPAGLAGPIDLVCLSPIHHVLLYRELHRLTLALRERLPAAEVRLHVRTLLRDLSPFALLPVDRVERLVARGGRGELAAGLRRLAGGRPRAVVLLAPPPGWRRRLGAHPDLRVVATAPLGFRTGGGPGHEAASEAFLAALHRESPRWVAPASPPPLGPAPRLLLHQSRFHVGDTLWLTPLLAAIGQRLPGAAVTLVGPPVARLLAGIPCLAEVLPFHPREGDEGRRRVLAALSGRRFDAALFAFARRAESRWIARWAAESDVPFRVSLEYVDPALDADRLWGLATHEGWFFWGSIASPRMLLHVLDPLLPPGESAAAQPARVDLAVPTAARGRAAAALAARGIEGEPFAVLAPGGSSSRRWPAASFAELARRLAVELGLHVLVEGSPDERELVAEVAALASAAGEPPRRILAADDPLEDLAALLGRARLLVGNDSAPIHLADAAGTPTLYLAQREKLVHSHPENPACRALYDDAGNDPAAITVEQVMGAVREVLRVTAAGRPSEG